MATTRDGSAKGQTWRDECARAYLHNLSNDYSMDDEELDPSTAGGLADLYEAIADLLATRGSWQQAYRHLRSALDLRRNEIEPQVPEQLRNEVDRLRQEHARAREQSLRDKLTGSYNRRYLDERLTQLVTEGKRLGLALVDLDWFKHINDTHGHVFGDRVLRLVVELLQDSLPDGGFCARYGGEEFVLVLPEVDATTAVSACERARSRVEEFAWHRIARDLSVTVSIGLVHDRGEHGVESTANTIESNILSADVLLYAAKQSGRNTLAYRSDGSLGAADPERAQGILFTHH